MTDLCSERLTFLFLCAAGIVAHAFEFLIKSFISTFQKLLLYVDRWWSVKLLIFGVCRSFGRVYNEMSTFQTIFQIKWFLGTIQKGNVIATKWPFKQFARIKYAEWPSENVTWPLLQANRCVCMCARARVYFVSFGYYLSYILISFCWSGSIKGLFALLRRWYRCVDVFTFINIYESISIKYSEIEHLYFPSPTDTSTKHIHDSICTTILIWSI